MTVRPRVLLATAVVAFALGCGGEDATGPVFVPPPRPPARPSLNPTYRPSGHMAAGDVFVHLFEWKWTDVAAECEDVLGPLGYRAVQVSPPQEHSIVPSRDWSQRYQPVSYGLERSRSGSEGEFASMVARCGAAGVDVIVDAVINHMTNFPSPGIGSNGTSYTKYEYPGLYTPADFHPPCALTDYQDAANVQECELFSLPDLHTGLVTVRQEIADYLISLARMGVAGFRIDAAKHIQQTEMDDIVDRVNQTLAGEGRSLPYVFLEISGGAGEALSESDFFGVGYGSGGVSDVTEFTFVGVGNKFRGLFGEFVAQLDPDGPPGSRFSQTAWGLIPSDKAVIFLQNHDTQHQCGIGYRDGDVFRLANVWMLAQPYGYPKILSSYAFHCPTGNSMGPPSDAAGNTDDVTCAASLETAEIGDWVCEHRDPFIAGMVGFRSAVAGTGINDWWDDGGWAIAFSRGDRGFVALSLDEGLVSIDVATPLRPGDYCDVLSGGLNAGACVGRTATVEPDGTVRLDLETGEAVAIHTDTGI